MQDKTILAIDYGSRRVGLAKSDPFGMIASALKTVEVRSDADTLAAIRAAIDEYHPAGVVIGYPLLASGDKSRKCEEIDRFIDKLSKVYAGPIIRVDESDTSTEAASIVHAHGKRIGKKKARIDRIAAVLILQRYLDEQSER